MSGQQHVWENLPNHQAQCAVCGVTWNGCSHCIPDGRAAEELGLACPGPQAEALPDPMLMEFDAELVDVMLELRQVPDEHLALMAMLCRAAYGRGLVVAMRDRGAVADMFDRYGYDPHGRTRRG